MTRSSDNMEKILTIEECFEFDGIKEAWYEQDGFKITTTLHIIHN